MKKGLLLLLAAFMALGASVAYADSRSEGLNANPQMIDDMDLIFLYPNLVTQYKNVFDVRTDYLTAGSEWGGFLDGEHTDLGVIGAYVNRPVGYDGGRQWNFNGPGWFGVGSGWSGNSWNIFSGKFTASNVNLGAGVIGHFNAPTPENKVDAFWGTGSDKGNFGVQVNYGDNQPSGTDPSGLTQNSVETNNATTADNSKLTADDDARVLGVNLGMGTEDLGPFNSANLHVGFFLGSLDMQNTNVPNTAVTPVLANLSLKDGGIYTATLGGLLKHTLDENSDLRLFANAYMDQNDQKEVQTFDATGTGLHNNAGDFDERWNGNYSDFLLDFGLGCNHKVLDGKATISSGLDTVWANSDTKLSGTSQDGNTNTVTYVPQDAGAAGWDEQGLDEWSLQWNANVEAKATDWLTLRAGLNRPIIDRLSTVTTVNTYTATGSVQSSQKTTAVSDNYFGNSTNTYSMGFGINWQNWELDGVIRTASLYSSIGNVAPGNGLLFTSGNPIIAVYDADIRFRF